MPTDQPDSSKDQSCLFDAEPSKEFAGSTLDVSPSLKLTSSPIGKSRKKSLRKLSVPCSPIIPLNDDCSELSEEREQMSKNKSLNKSSDKSGAQVEEQDASIVNAMSLDQMREHVECCLQLSTENKITTKNAFALKLIDCLTVITKTADENNFAAMACQLDAGAKIYSHRVDAVHQQVMSLAESCIMADKRGRNNKNGDSDDGEPDVDGTGEGQGVSVKRKTKKKKVIAKDEDLTRMLKPVDPRDAFVRVDALPGEILRNARYNSYLALTLERHIPFWPEPPASYKPVRCDGDCPIQPDLYRSVIKSHTLGPSINLEATVANFDFDLSKMTSSQDIEGGYEDFDNEDMADAGVQESSHHSSPDKDSNSDLNIINIARARMMGEGSTGLKRHEVISALFHKPDESEYHYLKMENSRYWAGPEYWKRPHVGAATTNQAANKKSIVRKKKEPAIIEYKTPDKTKAVNKSKRASADPKQKTVLSTKTIGNWSKKNVTYPADIHFDPSEFTKLYTMQTTPEVEGATGVESKAEINTQHENGIENDDAAEGIDHDDSIGAAEVCEEEEDRPVAEKMLDRDMKENLMEEASGSSLAVPISERDRKGDCSDCEIYEGENLVPMVKTVKVDPIQFVAKPNRVDMFHLKEVMLALLMDVCGNKENSRSGKDASIKFSQLLKNLFASPQLHRQTREDLTVPMAFLALLTLTNEHCFILAKKGGDDGDVTISLPEL